MIQNANLIALFQSGNPYYMADLYTITLLSGQVIRMTSADIPLIVTGNTFLPTPLMTRDAIKLVAGLEVDDVNITFYPSDLDMVGSVTFATAAFRGMFDNAQYLHERAFFTYASKYLRDESSSRLTDESGMYLTAGGGSQIKIEYVDKIIRFQGTIQDIQDGGRTQIPMTVKSDLILLNVKLPNNIYQPGCRRVLFDSGCAVNKTTFGIDSTVLTGSTSTQINCGLTQAGGATGVFSGHSFGAGDNTTKTFSSYVTAFPVSVDNVYLNGVMQASGWGYMLSGLDVIINFITAPASGVIVSADVTYSQSGWFDLGTVTFTSGANNGVSRTVKSYSPGVLTFSRPWAYTPAPGDTFTAYAGCDKQQATCGGKFNNLSRFSAECFVPSAETAY